MRRILIAEDDREIRVLLSRVLESEGYAVEAAADGRAALEAVAASPPDLLVTDLVMPRLSGWSLFARVRQQAPGLPILVVSGVDAAFPHRETAPPDGVAFLRKPFDIDHLLATVARLAEGASGAGPDAQPTADGDAGRAGS